MPRPVVVRPWGRPEESTGLGAHPVGCQALPTPPFLTEAVEIELAVHVHARVATRCSSVSKAARGGTWP